MVLNLGMVFCLFFCSECILHSLRIFASCFLESRACPYTEMRNSLFSVDIVGDLSAFAILMSRCIVCTAGSLCDEFGLRTFCDGPFPPCCFFLLFMVYSV